VIPVFLLVWPADLGSPHRPYSPRRARHAGLEPWSPQSPGRASRRVANQGVAEICRNNGIDPPSHRQLPGTSPEALSSRHQSPVAIPANRHPRPIGNFGTAHYTPPHRPSRPLPQRTRP